MTRENNPLECGMSEYCSFDPALDYIGHSALARIKHDGPQRQVRGVQFDGDKCPPCAFAWPLYANDKQVGQVTTAIWSPRLSTNISLGMLDTGYWDHGQQVTLSCGDGVERNGVVTSLPA